MNKDKIILLYEIFLIIQSMYIHYTKKTFLVSEDQKKLKCSSMPSDNELNIFKKENIIRIPHIPPQTKIKVFACNLCTLQSTQKHLVINRMTK